MKIEISIILILAIVGTIDYYYYYSNDIQQQFQEWQLIHKKQYSQIEEQYRMKVFNLNFQIITQHNNNPENSFKMKLNQFADLTKEEFFSLYLQSKSFSNIYTQQQSLLIHQQNNSIPNGIDWRGITKVKDQGQCSAGWAFSVIGAIEAFYTLQQGKQLVLSEQQLIDCDTISNGCISGSHINGFKFAKSSGIVTATTYPYTAVKSQCQNSTGPYKITNYVAVSTEQTLKNALSSHPASAGVDAINWQLYSEGVFQNCTNTVINHYALIVGYEDSGAWILKNSWGANWGEEGYIRLAPGNTCGVIANAYQNV